MDEHSSPHCVGGSVLTSLCILVLSRLWNNECTCISSNQIGETPLTAACGDGELDTVIELLRAGAKTDIQNEVQVASGFHVITKCHCCLSLRKAGLLSCGLVLMVTQIL